MATEAEAELRYGMDTSRFSLLWLVDLHHKGLVVRSRRYFLALDLHGDYCF